MGGDDNRQAGAGPALPGGEVAAGLRRGAAEGEEVLGGEKREGAPHPVAGPEAHLGVPDRGDIREGVLGGAQQLVLGEGEEAIVLGGRRRGGEEGDDAAGLPRDEGAQHQVLDEREDRRVHAEGDAEHEDSDRREGRGFQQLAEGEAEVGHHGWRG